MADDRFYIDSSPLPDYNRIATGTISYDKIRAGGPVTAETEPIRAPQVSDDHQFFKKYRTLLVINIALGLALCAFGLTLGFLISFLII